MPLFPETITELQDNALAKAIFAEAKIEENPVTFEQVCRIMIHSRDNFSQDQSSIEVCNILAAHKLLDEKLSEKLTPEIISSVHNELIASMANIKEPDGSYRKGGIKADEKWISVPYTPPASTLDINFLIKQLLDWIENDLPSLNPIIKATLLHLHIKKIQPYSNANGHTARLLEIWYLKKNRIKILPYILPQIYNSRKEDYYKCISEFYASSDIQPFLHFIMDSLKDTVSSVRDANFAAMASVISDSRLAKMYENKTLIKRQYDFLCMIKESGASFQQEDLQLRKPYTKMYGNVSRTTVARDIKKYEDMGLIVLTKDGYVFKTDII